MINHVGTKTIETNRLILRRFEYNDAEAIFTNWASDLEVSRFWNWLPHKNIKETKSILKKWIKDYSNIEVYHWAIVLKSISLAIGYIYINEFNNDNCEIHFALSQKYWNQGITTEACSEVLNFAFSIVGIEKVITRHHKNNPASGRVMEKCGMKYIKTINKQYSDNENISGNYCIYEISRKEYNDKRFYNLFKYEEL